MGLTSRFLIFICSWGIALSTNAQTVQGYQKYQSEFDKGLTFKSVSYLNSVDNVNNIYSRALDEKLAELIDKDHHWSFTQSLMAGPKIQPDDLVENPQNIKALAKSLPADGIFLAQVRKDPKELLLSLYFFSSRTGELVSEERRNLQSDKTADVIRTLESLYKQIKRQLPYDALILSRTDNRVTINAGTKDGVRPGDSLNAVALVSGERHPKRKFLLKTQKAILGQVRVVKADNYLSFADVVSEVEPGVVGTDVKITGLKRVQHGDTLWTRQYTPAETLLSEDNKTVYGSKAREWVAETPATFGKVGAEVALGRFNNTMGLSDDTSLDSSSSIYPRINLEGEIWITPKYYIEASFAQGLSDINNPAGPPGTLTASLSQYRLAFGYNFLLKNDFFGPKVTVDLGLNNYRMFLDTTSTSGFTTMQYRSVPISLGGYLPIDQAQLWAVSGKVYFHMFPSLSEAPFSSGGNPDNTINQFEIQVEYKMSSRFHLKSGLEFLALSTNYSGSGGRPTPATNSSQRFTFLTFGVEYLF